MSNGTCGLGVFTLEGVTAPCSGNGDCVFDTVLARHVCQCYAGYDGLSDFQLTSSYTDCQSNHLALRIMWGLNLLVNVIMAPQLLRGIVLLVQKHLDMKAKARSAGRVYTILDNKALLAVTPYCAVGWQTQVAYCVMKIVDPTFHIGLSWAATILWAVSRSTVFFAANMVEAMLLRSLLKSERGAESTIRVNSLASMIHLVLVCLNPITTAIVPLVSTPNIDPFDPSQSIIAIGFFFGMTSALWGYILIQVLFVSRKARAILSASYVVSKDEHIKEVMDKLVDQQKHASKQAVLQSVVYMVITVLPFTWRYHDYILSILWMVIPVMANNYLKNIIRDSSKKSGSSAVETTKSSKRQVPGGRGKDVVSSSGSDTNVGGSSPQQPNHKTLNAKGSVLSEGSLAPFHSFSEGEDASASPAPPTSGRKKTTMATVDVENARVSPVARLLRSLTPTRKQAAQTQKPAQVESDRFAFNANGNEEDGEDV